MVEILDKLFIIILCTLLYLNRFGVDNAPVSLIIVITLSCLCTYFENKKACILSLFFFSALSIFFPFLIIFLPLIIYDILHKEDWKYGIIALVPVIISHNFFNLPMVILIILFICLSYYLKYKTAENKELLKKHYRYRDDTKELEILLEEKNKKLLENQEDSIHMATLRERNRISKEIHDSLGHLISRSLIQIGAMLTISKDQEIKRELELVKDSLSEGMDNIRASIHNLHDQSIDLYSEINSLVKGFTFCSISFDYNIQNPPDYNLKHFFISTIKEGLANIMKHSNATNASIILMEHPIMYQLIIYDNGQLSKSDGNKVEEMNSIVTGKGMGLRTIAERVQALGGIAKFSVDQGVKIFITIPINRE